MSALLQLEGGGLPRAFRIVSSVTIAVGGHAWAFCSGMPPWKPASVAERLCPGMVPPGTGGWGAWASWRPLGPFQPCRRAAGLWGRVCQGLWGARGFGGPPLGVMCNLGLPVNKRDFLASSAAPSGSSVSADSGQLMRSGGLEGPGWRDCDRENWPSPPGPPKQPLGPFPVFGGLLPGPPTPKAAVLPLDRKRGQACPVPPSRAGFSSGRGSTEARPPSLLPSSSLPRRRPQCGFGSCNPPPPCNLQWKTKVENRHR